MTRIMTDRIQYSIIPAPALNQEWEGHYVVTKTVIKGSWGEIPKGTIMTVVQSQFHSVFKTVPSKVMDFSVEVIIKDTKEAILEKFIHFIEPKTFY